MWRKQARQLACLYDVKLTSRAGKLTHCYTEEGSEGARKRGVSKLPKRLFLLASGSGAHPVSFDSAFNQGRLKIIDIDIGLQTRKTCDKAEERLESNYEVSSVPLSRIAAS